MNALTPLHPAPVVRELADDAQLVPEVPLKMPWPDLPVGKGLVALYPYKWENGRLAVLIARYERPDGGDDGRRKKSIVPYTLWQNSDGSLVWARKGLSENRPLYGLPELVERTEATVILSEGEKCADAVRDAFPSCVSMTWMGGANALAKTDFSRLAGRNVMIFPDHDEAGHAAAEKLVDILRELGASRIVVVDIEALGRLASTDVPKGYDIADAIRDGMDADCLRSLVAENSRLLRDVTRAPVDASEPDLAAEGAEGGGEGEVVDPVMKHLREHWGLELDPPDGFTLSDVGLIKHEVTARGVPIEIFVGSPIAVVGRSRTGDDGPGWGFCVTLRCPDGTWKTLVLANVLLAGDGKEMREKLAEHGFVCPQDRAGRQALAEYISHSAATEVIDIASRPGWHEDCFVLPQAIITPPESNRRIELDMQGRSHFFAEAGSFERWKDLAALAEHSSRAAFVLCIAFAGPLLRPLGEGGGGFHLFGRSSRGKTTLLRFAASAWGGGGRDGFVRSWLATGNGIEGVAADHNDVLIALDELTMMPPELAADLYYMLANGHGKSRANKTGAAQSSAQWYAMALSSGEDTSAAHIRSGPRGSQRRLTGGLAVRMVDIPIEPEPGRSFEDLAGFKSEGALAEHIGREACAVYGHAGPAFLRQLIADKQAHLAKARDIMEGFVETVTSPEDDPQVGRIAKRFGLVAAAGTLATEFGIMKWGPDAARNAAVTCYEAWKKTRGTSRSEEEREALRALREFFELHGASRFEPVRPEGDAEEAAMSRESDWAVRDRCGYRALDEEGNAIYYVLPEAFRSHVCGGHSPETVLGVARECGALMLGEEGRLQKKVRLPEYPGGKRVYAFLLHALS